MSDGTQSSTEAQSESTTRTADTLETFSLLAQETRLTILRELSAMGLAEGAEPVTFAELRRRVGTADSGRFNYHLDKLQPQFVTHVDEDDGPTGYRPTWAGIRVIGAAMAGQFAGDSVAGESERTCPQCGADATLTHEDGLLNVDCENHDFQIPVPAGAAENRELDELLGVGLSLMDRLMELSRREICPNCYDTLTAEATEVEDGVVVFRDSCDRCRGMIAVPVGLFVSRHPAIVSFYYEHGIELDLERAWAADWTDPGAETIRERDPFRFELPVECDGDRITVVVDETGTVVDVEAS